MNSRLANQNHRIDRDVRDGKLSHAQASELHREPGQIRQEERNMAAQNGDHITRAEQRVLNQQNNQLIARSPRTPRASTSHILGARRSMIG